MANKMKFASIALGVVLLFSSAGAANAAYWSYGKCNSKIRKEQRELERAERRFGPWSRQANEERFELRRILDRCGYNSYGGFGGYGFHGRDDRWRHWDGDHDRDDHRRDRDRYYEWDRH